MTFTRRLALVAGIGSLAAHAQAQPAYPSKPIRIILPYAPGGPADVMIRAIGQKMSEAWGQPVIVDNKPGANEIVAADALAKSAGDGYTFMVASDSAFSLNQHLYPKIPYDPVVDFVPVSKLATAHMMLVVRPDLPVAHVKEFIELVKRSPGKYNYASIGAGSVNHLASAWFNSVHGLQMEHVAFKGLPAAVQELMAGRIDAMFAVTGGVAPHVESGKVKALAVSGRSRQPAATKVPTFTEEGYASFEASYYFGVVAPKGTPPEINARFARELARIIAADDFKTRYLQPLGFQAVGDTPEQFSAFLKTDREMGAQKVKVSGARLE
ncbi:MAG: tripartite tricarboxylate transporter substrate binding protein [Betaproteobacteria bacterium]